MPFLSCADLRQLSENCIRLIISANNRSKENDKKKVAHHGKVAIQLRQDKRRDRSVKEGFYTFDPKPIIRKMKIPILVFCLAVIFGNISCRIYSEESVNLIEGTADDDGDYGTSYFNVPLEKSLSRYKRASILSPVTDIAKLMGFGSNGFIKTILHFVDFISGLLTGQENLCPTVEKLSIDLIEKMLLHPIETTKTIFCYIFNAIGQEGRAIALRILKTVSDFLFTIFLPGLHTILNQMARTGLLPPNLRLMVESFNILYNFLRMMGYVQ